MKPKLLKGRVLKGEGWATLVGYPTANLDQKYFKQNPVASGVYACRVWLDTPAKKETTRQQEKKYKGIAIIGVSSFFKYGQPKVEVWLMDFKRNIVGRTLSAELVKKLRPLKKFKNAQGLIKQSKEDEQQARQVLKKH